MTEAIDIDELAERVAERVVELTRPPGRLLSVAEYAEVLGMSCGYVRQWAAELGGICLPTDGSRTVWRFDPAVSPAPQESAEVRPLQTSRSRNRIGSPNLLPIAGQDAA